jgi:hypothetical protein
MKSQATPDDDPAAISKCCGESTTSIRMGMGLKKSISALREVR